MFKSYLSLLLAAHILGDFYFQTNNLSSKKEKCYRYIVFHSLVYSVVVFACAIPVFSATLLLAMGVLAISHFAIDSLKYYSIQKNVRSDIVYITDQILHLVLIVAIASIITRYGIEITLMPSIKSYLSIINVNYLFAFKWIGLTLAICKPINITIKEAIAKYRPEEGDSETIDNAGSLIGSLERIIISILIGLGNYSAIGFVLTAKSVARYGKISESQKFAEYYLIGTLLSTLSAIVIYFIFM